MNIWKTRKKDMGCQQDIYTAVNGPLSEMKQRK